MIRRIALAFAALAVLVFPSTVASADPGGYPPPAVEITFCKPNPKVGEPCKVRVTHANPGGKAKLVIQSAGTTTPDVEIAGVKESEPKTVGADGTAEFSVVLNAPGEFQIAAVVDGVTLTQQQITAQTKATAAPATPAPAVTTSGGLDPLVTGLIGGGALALVGGGAFLLIRRRGLGLRKP